MLLKPDDHILFYGDSITDAGRRGENNNAGLGHVRDARRLARERGLNHNRWFGNVEKAIVLLEKQKYYKRARHGYCRGTEPVQYVSRIQTKYDAYSRLMPAEGK